jgi:hypothetical protein
VNIKQAAVSALRRFVDHLITIATMKSLVGRVWRPRPLRTPGDVTAWKYTSRGTGIDVAAKE